jgi:peptide/nickel transport system ATP-binding protein
MSAAPIVAVSGLDVHYPLPRERLIGPRPKVYAVNEVDLVIEPKRSVGVVGESGSGKSTLARAVMALETPSRGKVSVLGRDVNALPPDALRAHRRHFQMVFQDPYGSLDPRHTVERIVAEPLDALDPQDAATRRARVDATLASVGLKASDRDKYPHEFSGGQRQRIAIARALITRPSLIVADEPVSALDVSVQAQVLNLLADLGHEFGVTYLLISHDLAVVENVCDRVAVMYLGRIVEEGPTAALFARPAHPYTQALLDAVPRPDPARRGHIAALPGQVPSQTELPKGCGFAGRCPRAEARCHAERPAWREIAPGRRAACHFA